MSVIENDAVRLLAWILAGLGALNYGLKEFASFDLLTQFLSTGTTEYQVAIGALAVAGVLVLLEATEEVNA